jgi:hypothetical protein
VIKLQDYFGDAGSYKVSTHRFFWEIFGRQTLPLEISVRKDMGYKNSGALFDVLSGQPRAFPKDLIQDLRKRFG